MTRIMRISRVALYAFGAFGCFHIAHDLWFEETTQSALAFGGAMAVLVGLQGVIEAFEVALGADK